MNQESSTQAVDHLQRAAKELIAAARIFLDAAEEVVDDPAVLGEVADMAGEVVTGVVSEVRRGGWARPGSGRPFESDLDERDAAAEKDSADGGRRSGSSQGRDRSHERSGRAADTRSSEGVGANGASSGATGRGSKRSTRVKRIDVE